ncbi:MAG: DUF371 domain-containing protein [Nanoarchaeota archaeon]
MRWSEFCFRGHPTITAKHKTTLEITKDSSVTAKGDCIVGVSADFDSAKLRGLTGKHVLEIRSGQQSAAVVFEANPHFNDAHEIVIRRSTFLSPRTLGTMADKAACDLPLRFNDPSETFDVVIRPHEKAAEQVRD